MDKDVGCLVSAKRDPVANEVMSNLERLANMADKLSCRANDQLRPICQEDRLQNEKGECEPVREYPPMFNDMRDRMQVIEHALRRMNNLLDRCEV